jgi:hypothetical protein
LKATVKIVIGGHRPSCGTPASLGAIELCHIEDPVCSFECGLVVRDNQQGFLVLPADGQKHQQDLAGRPCIKTGTWFIGEDQWRAIGQRPRDGNPLLLAARELLRLMAETLGKAQTAKEIDGALTL